MLSDVLPKITHELYFKFSILFFKSNKENFYKPFQKNFIKLYSNSYDLLEGICQCSPSSFPEND